MSARTLRDWAMSRLKEERRLRQDAAAMHHTTKWAARDATIELDAPDEEGEP